MIAHAQPRAAAPDHGLLGNALPARAARPSAPSPRIRGGPTEHPAGPPTLNDARALLQHHFGYTEFRPAQARGLATLLRGGDLLAVQPTGSGKTLVYVLAGLCLGGMAVVVSPLISLM